MTQCPWLRDAQQYLLGGTLCALGETLCMTCLTLPRQSPAGGQPPPDLARSQSAYATVVARRTTKGWSTVFPGMPDAQHDDHAIQDFVPHFVITDEITSHLARPERLQASADPRMMPKQPGRRRLQGAHRPRGRLPDDRCKKIIKPDEVGPRRHRPTDAHQRGCGGGSSRSVPRLSAQACIASSSMRRPASTSARASCVIRRRRSNVAGPALSLSRPNWRCYSASAST